MPDGHAPETLATIGEAGEQSGLAVKTIRYYEDIGLVRPARGANGYRAFRSADIHRLTFLARARSLGFPVEECRALHSLWEDRERASADVKALARRHLADIQRKIEELEAMRDTLGTLVDQCHGDTRPDCPILDDLANRNAAKA